MRHLGDITKINGAEAPVVDCIIGGSPCQDLSIAGKRAGLAGERSGLYMDQIRVIKEMRANDRANGRTGEFVRPRYMVWENVPGAFSSNNGQDFAAVLEEAVKVSEAYPPLFMFLKKDGQHQEWSWETDGASLGEYSMHSFGESPNAAAESHLSQILEDNPLQKYYLSAKACQGILNRAERRGKDLPPELKQALATQSELGGGCDGGGKGALVQTEVSGTLGCNNDQTIFCLNDQGGNIMNVSDGVSATLRAQEHGHQPCILDISHRGDVVRECGELVPSLCARAGTGGNNVPVVYRQRGFGDYQEDEIGSTCKQRDGKDSTDLVVGVDCNSQTITGDASPTLRAIKSDPDHIPCIQQKRVRRLTPLECERLQGFPDFWTNIGTWVDSKGRKRETSDAARYKALGNSIALPPWKWVLKRLCAQYERDATMASLFDGIGGFPLIWEQLNGKGSCLWASEIEEFPIAVTRERFK